MRWAGVDRIRPTRPPRGSEPALRTSDTPILGIRGVVQWDRCALSPRVQQRSVRSGPCPISVAHGAAAVDHTCILTPARHISNAGRGVPRRICAPAGACQKKKRALAGAYREIDVCNVLQVFHNLSPFSSPVTSLNTLYLARARGWGLPMGHRLRFSHFW